MNEQEGITGIEVSQVTVITDVLHDCPLLLDEVGNVLAGVKIYDANSARYRKAKRQLSIEAVKRSSMRRKAIDTKTDAGAEAVLDLVQGNETTKALAVVADWYGFVSDGKPLSYDSEMFSKMLTARPSWVDAINEKATEVAGFFETSKTS